VRYGQSRHVVRLPATLDGGTAREILQIACGVRNGETFPQDDDTDWVDPEA